MSFEVKLTCKDDRNDTLWKKNIDFQELNWQCVYPTVASIFTIESIRWRDNLDEVETWLTILGLYMMVTQTKCYRFTLNGQICQKSQHFET